MDTGGNKFKTARVRLDEYLVRQGLARDLKEAQALVLAGEVKVGGRPAPKAGALVKEGEAVEIKGKPPYVSRGGLKLEAALDRFGISVQGLVCLDIGASTGGFTDCLLKRGAAKVYAVDVGRGQLDWKLRQDPRVACREQTHARELKPADFAEPPGFFCMDVSFTSSAELLRHAAPLLKPGGLWVVLVKPQFEADRKEVKKGGIVDDPAVHQRVCDEVFEAANKAGLGPVGVIPSPIQGAEGNREFLMGGKKPTVE